MLAKNNEVYPKARKRRQLTALFVAILVIGSALLPTQSLLYLNGTVPRRLEDKTAEHNLVLEAFRDTDRTGPLPLPPGRRALGSPTEPLEEKREHNPVLEPIRPQDANNSAESTATERLKAKGEYNRVLEAFRTTEANNTADGTATALLEDRGEHNRVLEAFRSQDTVGGLENLKRSTRSK